MQIIRETINNQEIQLHITISKLKKILLVCLINFSSLLVRQTLQVQHSCNPMIHWSGSLTAECQIAINTSSDNFDDFSYPRQQELKAPKHKQNITQEAKKSELNNIHSESKTKSNLVSQFIDEHSKDIVGFTTGVAAGVGSVAAASATAAFSMPIAGAAAIGMGIWFLIRSTLK